MEAKLLLRKPSFTSVTLKCGLCILVRFFYLAKTVFCIAKKELGAFEGITVDFWIIKVYTSDLGLTAKRI